MAPRSCIALCRTAVAVLALLIPLAALGHTTGVSFEKVIGAYKADIGYDPAAPAAGAPERFDFDLYQQSSGNEADFGDIWVRVMQGNNTLFATGIHRPYLGKATLLYTFPAAGTYTIDARFEKDETAIAETSFPLSVSAGPQHGVSVGFAGLAGALVVGLLVGAAGVFLISRK